MTTTSPRKLPVDPAWIALAVAALVLIAAAAWLMSRERPAPMAEARPGVAATPSTPAPPPDPMAPLNARIEELTRRLQASEAALAELRARPSGDPAAIAALRQELAAARDAGRREAAESATALRNEAEARARAAEEALTRRLAEAQSARASAEQALARRVEAAEQAAAQAPQAAERRVAALEQQINERLAPVQESLRRIAATEARAERLAAIDALNARLGAGQPLGDALGRLGAQAPAALTRYASASPPTEAALRLSFEDAVRRARAATQAQDGLIPRLNSLITIRRGEEVVWGDASETQVERARRALEAGDVPGALAALALLPDTLRQALGGWIAEAEGLAAARAALRQLAAG
ncbi:hypothetical protein [Roseococcus sp. YIM B11640]|uniref:hypothetical protein n=1 Tax=Roseococcus sp. YIM B11640 TaxID=3133973 RepID=UPI003C7C90EC